MKTHVAPNGVPIHVWSRRPPPGAIAQLEKLAAEPWITGPIAAMPDLHVAAGIAVGTVFATKDTLVPAALGDDLGCGMSATRFDLPAAALGNLPRLLERLADAIPTGDGIHRKSTATLDAKLSTNALQRACERLAPRHLGTLGGGNHFLELDRDAGGNLWLVVHSGSRGVGGAIARAHPSLADLEVAFDFARRNRAEIARTATALIGAAPIDHVDLHHNFVRRERGLLVHRKGAISAALGERGLIPGSMGTATYVVEGLGNPLAYASASHGAGRVLTRKEARKTISPAQLEASMRRVVFDTARSRDLVEEAPAAYRDLREVLEDEADLVRPVLRLEPIAVLKG